MSQSLGFIYTLRSSKGNARVYLDDTAGTSVRGQYATADDHGVHLTGVTLEQSGQPDATFPAIWIPWSAIFMVVPDDTVDATDGARDG